MQILMKTELGWHSNNRQNRLKIKNYHKRTRRIFVLIKVSTHQKDITIINLYTLNNTVPKYIKHTSQNIRSKYWQH